MVDGMREMRGPESERRGNAAKMISTVPSLRRSALMVAAAFGALTTLAQANPEGAKVVNGQATISSHGNTLVIKNSPGAIINWQSFSIGAGQVTDFIQQSVNSAILNRVVGADPSVILGTLESNGHVFLVNPNGVVFGKGATVDAAGLVVSSLNITDQDFKNGTLRFVGSDAAGDISVAGVLRSSDGDVYLIAPNVTNTGSITATNGAVVLAAGQDVEILGAGLTDIQFNVQNKSNSAINLGQINGDAVGIFAGTLTQAGGVNATTATVSGGKVVLSALGDVTLASGSSTTADNPGGSAGSVSIQSAAGNIGVASGANVSASGASGGTITLLASAGSDSISGHLAATGDLTLAGSIDVLGQTVAVGGTSVMDATGATGGGQIAVGGLAKSAALLQASSTTVDSGAILTADATGSGDGGHVVVYGSSFMRMDGSISAQGGVSGGNGGLIETSGEVISIGDGTIAARARAAGGKAGTWLLDPGSVDIEATGADASGGSNGTASTVAAGTIASALQLGNNVVIETSSAIGGPTLGATITVNSPIVATDMSNSATLTLSAGGGIAINAGITGTPTNPGIQVLTLVLASGLDGTGTTAPITVNAPIYIPGGTLTVTGDSFNNSAGNVITALNVNIGVTGTAGFVNRGTFLADLDDNDEADFVGNGGSITVNAANGPITTGSMNTNSSGGSSGSIQLNGAGVMISGALSSSDEASGSGGSVTLMSSNGINSTTGASIAVTGGSGPNNVGAGGTVILSDTGTGGISLSGMSIVANGGSSIGSSGSSGGSGGTVSIATTGGYAINLSNVSITDNGGVGSIGTFQVGGAGGNGGFITISGGSIAMTGGSLLAVGGAGSVGGTGTGTFNGYNGGMGGSGGNISISAEATVSDSGTSIRTQGGVGGAGGNFVGTTSTGQTAGYGGTGGYGGSIQLVGNGGITLTGVNYQTIGGAGGAGGLVNDAGDATALGGNGGTGGDGGYISIQEESGNIGIVNSTFNMLGGAGGAAIASTSTTGSGGSGGAGGTVSSQLYAFNLSAAGGVTIDSATHITVLGGSGGVGAPGYEPLVGVTQGGTGGDGGNVSGILINGSSGSVSLAGSIVLQGGAAGVGGNINGTIPGGGSGNLAGAGGNGGSVGLSSTALSLSALNGNLVHTGTISIIGGAGGAGGSGVDTFALAANGGDGGNIGEVDIYGSQTVNFAGTLSIVGGAGGGLINTNANNATAPLSSGSGGSQIEPLTIQGNEGLNLGGIINLEVGPAGHVTQYGSAGTTGALQTIQLAATAGAITQSAGALVSTSTPLNVNASAGSISLNSPSNTIGILTASASSGALTVVSMINMEAQSIVGAGSITLVAANGTTGNLTIDDSISTTAGYINLSAGSQILVGGNLSAPQIDMTSGSLTLNSEIDASNLINISLTSGALTNNGQTLTAPAYVLNAAGGVGSAATPLVLAPPEGSAAVVSGGSTGGGFYISAAGDISVNTGLAIAAAGDVQLLAGGAAYNSGTISAANVNLSATLFASNFGVIDTGGALTMTAPTVVNQGSASAGSINLVATDVDIISGSLVASGDMSISGGAVSIGFNGASTTVNAHNISIVGDSLSVSPDISGSGSASNTGAPLVSINAAGTLTITTTGDATFVAGTEPGSYVSVTSVGDSTYNIGGNLSLTGGTGAHAYTLLDPTAPGSTMTINATNLGLTGGSGDGSYAAIQGINDIIINATSGSIMLTQGTGKDADAVVVAGSGGSIVANTPSCINCVQTVGPQPIGDGTTEQGFYVATAAAPPPVPPVAAPPAPNQTAIDIFIGDLVILLNGPIIDQGTDLSSTVLVDGSTDGCI